MAAKINKKMNLVLEIEQETDQVRPRLEDGKPVLENGRPVMEPVMRKLYAHSVPILEETYERYALLLAEVITTVYGKNFGVGMAGRVALLIIRQLAQREGTLEEVQKGLINEIERLTSIIALDPQRGWQPMPVAEALRQEVITPEEYKEVMSNAAFFTAVSWLQTRKEQKQYVFPMMRVYSAQIVSSTATEFAASLPTSTPAETTKESSDTPLSSVLV